jgi:hypothetical protein
MHLPRRHRFRTAARGSASAATLATPNCSARYAGNPEQSGHIKIPTIPHNPGKLDTLILEYKIPT